jgi:diguanylate cyclase (GGDEF)-like protein
MGHYELARMQLEEGLALASRTGIDREIFKTHKMLADLHKQFGNFERALNHHEQFHQVRARVFDEMGRLKLARLADQLELERIQRERETSQLRNVELARVLSEVQRLNEELTEKAKAFEYLSNQDTLTGLYNRRFLYARMNEEIGRVDRHGSRLAVVLYDVDHFKLVNDQHSHTLGDDVLRTIAKVVTQALRHTDVHVRYGGEEFAVMMPETSLEQAEVVAEKLRELVSSFEWHQIAPKLSLSISAGVVALRDGESMADILRRVDAKLYEAKRGGRNRVMVG